MVAGMPVNAGNYTATISAGGASASVEFIISKANTPVVSISDWKYGETASEPSVEGNTGNGTVTYLYSKDGANWTEDVPENAGKYYVKACVAETDNFFNAVSEPVSFGINQANKPAALSADSFTITDVSCSGSTKGSISGVTSDMEYRINASDVWTQCTGSEISELDAGSYSIRMRKNDNYENPGDEIALTVKRTPHDCSNGHIENKPATCTENGYIEYYRCAVCKEYFSDKECNDIITDLDKWLAGEGLNAKTGHSFDDNWTSDENSHWHKAVCGDTDEVRDKSNHTWDTGRVTTEATCTEDGVRTFTCTVCSQTKTEKIEATGHSFDTAKWISDENSHWHKASCGDTEEVIDKAEHTWDTGRVTKEATVSSAGIRTYTCTVCEAVKTDEIPKLAPTQAPTGTPSQTPTQAPTGTPSQTPTQAPTGTPSQTPTQAPTGTPVTPTETPTRTPENGDNTNTNTGDVTGGQDTKPEEKVTTIANEDGTAASIPESFIDSIKLTKSEQKAVENGAEIKLEVSADEKKATKTEKKNAQAAADEIAAVLENIGITAGNGAGAGNTDGTNTGTGNTDGTNTGTGNADGTNAGAGNADGTNTGNTDGNTTGTGSTGNTASAPSLTVGPTYNVSMTKQVGDGEKKAVKTNGSEASFTVSVPVSENLLNTDDSMKRLYFMVSTNADGTQNVVPAKLDTEANTLSFEASGNGKVTLVTTDVAYFEEKGTELATSAKLNAKYSVAAPGTKAGQTGVVGYTGPQKKKASLTVKDTVKINGIAYKITSVAEGAFAGNKKLKKLTVGRNIITIGAGAFKGCKNLKEIVINSKLLKAKNLSAEAFEGLSEDVVIYVPAKKLKAYTTMFKKLGVKAELKAIK